MSCNALPSRARSAHRFQVVQECLGVLQVGGIVSFHELIVDWPEKFVRFDSPVLITPETGKVCRGAKFEGECPLAVSRFDRLLQPPLGLLDLIVAPRREACAR